MKNYETTIFHNFSFQSRRFIFIGWAWSIGNDLVLFIVQAVLFEVHDFRHKCNFDRSLHYSPLPALVLPSIYLKKIWQTKHFQSSFTVRYLFVSYRISNFFTLVYTFNSFSFFSILISRFSFQSLFFSYSSLTVSFLPFFVLSAINELSWSHSSGGRHKKSGWGIHASFTSQAICQMWAEFGVCNFKSLTTSTHIRSPCSKHGVGYYRQRWGAASRLHIHRSHERIGLQATHRSMGDDWRFSYHANISTPCTQPSVNLSYSVCCTWLGKKSPRQALETTSAFENKDVWRPFSAGHRLRCVWCDSESLKHSAWPCWICRVFRSPIWCWGAICGTTIAPMYSNLKMQKQVRKRMVMALWPSLQENIFHEGSRFWKRFRIAQQRR